MRHYKTVDIPARKATTEERYYKTTCDLCGSRIEEEHYKVDEVKLSHRVGYHYPEGGSGEKTSVDMCGECFDNELIPWLKIKGVEPITEEWDY